MGRIANTLIYVRNVYVGSTQSEKKFKRDVEDTQEYAHNLEDHIKKIKSLYPNYNVIPLYTYRHSGTCIEKFERCKWDSSLNGLAIFKNEKDLDKKLELINNKL